MGWNQWLIKDFVDGISNEMFEVKMIIDHLSIGLRTDGDVHFMWIFFAGTCSG